MQHRHTRLVRAGLTPRGQGARQTERGGPGAPVEVPGPPRLTGPASRPAPEHVIKCAGEPGGFSRTFGDDKQDRR